MGKNYKPAKPGDKDYPDKKSYEKAQGEELPHPDGCPCCQSGTTTLNQLSDYYYEKPVLNDPHEDWDGYSFYSENEILEAMPELKNVEPSYDDETVVNKGEETPSDSKINPEKD